MTAENYMLIRKQKLAAGVSYLEEEEKEEVNYSNTWGSSSHTEDI